MRLTVQQSDIPERPGLGEIGKMMALCFGPYAYPATIVRVEVPDDGEVLVTFDVPGTEISPFTD